MYKFVSSLLILVTLTACSQPVDGDLEKRVQELEEKNAELQKELEKPPEPPKKAEPTLYNDGVVKVKCQELRDESQYQSRTLSGNASRSYDIYYSPVLNTCVVEQTTIETDGSLWYVMYDGLGEIGASRIIGPEYNTRCTPMPEHDYVCPTWNDYAAERNRILP